MIRGTTPKHTFNVPMDTGRIKCLKLTYTQLDEVILTKRTKDFTFGDRQVSVKLNQEETFLFNSDVNVTLQLRGLTVEGDVISTNALTVDVEKCLDDEVLV